MRRALEVQKEKQNKLQDNGAGATGVKSGGGSHLETSAESGLGVHLGLQKSSLSSQRSFHHNNRPSLRQRPEAPNSLGTVAHRGALHLPNPTSALHEPQEQNAQQF